MANSGNCCEEHNFELDAEILDSLADDPALQDCCRRDLETQAKVARIKARLTPHDPSQTRQRLAAQVICRKTFPSEPQMESEEDVLERLRDLRLAEMRIAAAQQASLLQSGGGSFRTISSQDIRKELLEDINTPTVCHILQEGSLLGDQVDEFLTVLSHHHLRTRFLRALGPPSDQHLSSAFVCQVDGKCSNVNLDAFCDEDGVLNERKLEAWLYKSKCITALEEREGHGAYSSDEDCDEWEQPCHECGRRYPHEHVRSIRRHRSYEHDDNDDDDF